MNVDESNEDVVLQAWGKSSPSMSVSRICWTCNVLLDLGSCQSSAGTRPEGTVHSDRGNNGVGEYTVLAGRVYMRFGLQSDNEECSIW